MALNEEVAKLRAERMQEGRNPVPNSFQGVTKGRIKQVLESLHLGDNVELVDGVFALLDDETPSWFSKAPVAAQFCDGASTAHLGCHIGILQRGNGKLDREGRDYWIKPLRELGGIEPITLFEGEFIHGHPIAKSPNSAYRLTEEFKAILQAGASEWPQKLTRWASQDAARARREFQAQAAEAARLSVDNSHSDLIKASISLYAAKFLRGYEVIYVDDGDGDRITAEDREKLQAAGVEFQLGDAMPDVLLWNPATNRLWVIEAVTSDGEVDLHKVDQLMRLARRCGKVGIGFTTTYQTWKTAAARQGTFQNIAVNTHIWIQADPAKQLLVQSFTWIDPL
ncbi:BsuBI/PstI family type II restriction endonuclease [Azospirillum doebereinerae]|uniref:BsuBI/PstI family type II restriction endonuclease n=1 Tax=Azospirillum doebereinerae TaxID=92933 RepID=UPI001EE61CBF|nr:BsuBI/PstI family type II restriction endonuclease [Azospirillum doebereinerae]MCG5244105.1 hypothetical protein [Azospirillum doebereinerae]